MSESVILGSPLAFILFALAFASGAFAAIKRSGGYFFPVVSATLFVAAAVYSLLSGATLQELLIVTLLFFVAGTSAFTGGRDGK